MNQFIGELVPFTNAEKKVVQKRIDELRKMLKISLGAIFLFTWLLPIFLRWIINQNIEPEDFYIKKGQPVPEKFELLHLIIVMAVLNIFALSITGALIVVPLRKFVYDFKKGMKIRFDLPVLRKQFMAINQTFFMHLYHNKPFIIEISGHDFSRISEGDKVSLFYTPKSAIYLGYHINT